MVGWDGWVFAGSISLGDTASTSLTIMVSGGEESSLLIAICSG
ncbi:MAG: hypothetical protein Q8N89_10260 [Azonexus sp.]|nr:hypothetical protein [Azonexus sp.]